MSNLIENHVADVAVTMFFGLGYYLFKTIKNKKEQSQSHLNEKGGNKLDSSLKEKLEGSLEQWQYARTIEDYHQLISQNEEEGLSDPFAILNMMNRKGILPTIETYNALLLNCFNSNNLEQAEILKEEMLDPTGPVTPNVTTLNVLIYGLWIKYKMNSEDKEEVDSYPNPLFAQFDKELMSLIELLENRNVFMDLHSQNTILEALIDQKRLFEAWNHFINMKKLFSPNLYTYTTFLKGIKLFSEAQYEDWFYKAQEIFQETKANYKLNEEVYTLMIEICIKFSKLDKAGEVFENFKCSFDITKEVYHLMIKGYGKIFNLEKAIDIFNQVKDICKQREEKINASSYEAILTACVRCKNINKAENLVIEMTQNNIEKSLLIYITMIHGYRKGRNHTKAIELYEYLLEKVLNKADSVKMITLTTSFFNAILDCCVDGNKYDKMNEIFEFLKAKSNNDKDFPQMDLVTYSIIMKGYAKSNSINKVTELYSYLRSRKDFLIDEVLYNTIIDCYARHNDEQNVLRVYSDMKTNKVKTSVITYGVLIKLYCNLGNCNRAFELFDECIKTNNKPSVVIYQMLIKLQVKFKFIDRAITLFRNMLVNNIKADQQVYELIIKACINQDRLNEAVEFTLSASAGDIKLEKHVYQNVCNLIIDSNSFKHFEKNEILNQLMQRAENYLESGLKEKISLFISTPIKVMVVDDIFKEEKSLYEEVENNLNNYYKRNFEIKTNGTNFVNKNYKKELNQTNYNGNSNKKSSQRKYQDRQNFYEERSIYA